MFCIMLAMGFMNAIAETARDADVYRIFARGQGFKATEKAPRQARAWQDRDSRGPHCFSRETCQVTAT